MPKSHIVKAFDEELTEIEDLLLEMGGAIERQIADAAEALLKRDVELGEKVRRGDKRIDEYEAKIDDLAVRLIARRQPMADDLRSVLCVLKVSGSLERIGDYAKNIGKRTTVLADEGMIGSAATTIKQMSKIVQEMLTGVLDAYVKRDVEMANAIRDRDEEVDLLHNTLFRELLTYMMEDPRSITASMHLLFIAKNVERVGDHITSIAEQVHFLVKGTLPEEERPKGDMTSYISVESKQR